MAIRFTKQEKTKRQKWMSMREMVIICANKTEFNELQDTLVGAGILIAGFNHMTAIDGGMYSSKKSKVYTYVTTDGRVDYDLYASKVGYPPLALTLGTGNDGFGYTSSMGNTKRLEKSDADMKKYNVKHEYHIYSEVKGKKLNSFIKNTKQRHIRIGDHGRVIFRENGIKIGCQKISLEDVKEIYMRAFGKI